MRDKINRACICLGCLGMLGYVLVGLTGTLDRWWGNVVGFMWAAGYLGMEITERRPKW